MPIEVFLYAALVVAAVGVTVWALRGAVADNPARAKKLVRANLGPSVATAPDMREVVLAQPAWERVGAPTLQPEIREPPTGRVIRVVNAPVDWRIGNVVWNDGLRHEVIVSPGRLSKQSQSRR